MHNFRSPGPIQLAAFGTPQLQANQPTHWCDLGCGYNAPTTRSSLQGTPHRPAEMCFGLPCVLSRRCHGCLARLTPTAYFLSCFTRWLLQWDSCVLAQACCICGKPCVRSVDLPVLPQSEHAMTCRASDPWHGLPGKCEFRRANACTVPL